MGIPQTLVTLGTQDKDEGEDKIKKKNNIAQKNKKMSNTDLRTYRHIIGQNEEDESHYLKPGRTQRHRQR